MPIIVENTRFADARIFYPVVHEDDRGFFKETYSREKYRSLGLLDDFVQDSVSFSGINVIRGLHCDPEMSKFVQCLRGRIFDVIVDMRKTSPTFGKWQGFLLSEFNHRQLYVPKGFAHGFLSLSDDVVFSYKHGAFHDATREFALRWDDPTVSVAWPLIGQPRISAKDRNAATFEELRATI